MSYHRILDEFQRRGLIAGRGDERLQDLALVVDGPPEVARPAVDLHVDLVEVPAPLGVRPLLIAPLLADLYGEQWTKPVPPQSHRLVADVDDPLEQQALDVTQGKRVFHVHHDHDADHLGRRVEPAKRAVGGIFHGRMATEQLA